MTTVTDTQQTGLVVRISQRITTRQRRWHLLTIQNGAGAETKVPIFPGLEELIAGVEVGDWIAVTGTLLAPTATEATPALVPERITRPGQYEVAS